MSKIIYISKARLSFPHLVDPQVNINQQTGIERTAYNCDLILAEDHPGFKEFMKVYGEIALSEWKEQSSAIMQMIANDRKSRCFGRGEEKQNQKTLEVFDGYKGHMYISSSNKNRPQIIQPDGKAIDPLNTMAYGQLTRSMYAGCYVNAAIKPWPQKPGKGYGRGIRCDLIALQFANDGEPFGEGAQDASGLFKQVSESNVMPIPIQAAAMGLPPFMLG